MSHTSIAGKPILMSAPMVRALLANRKTQTRRIVKPQPPVACDRAVLMPLSAEVQFVHDATLLSYPGNGDWVRCPYGQPGDRLWVRETWAHGLGPIGERFDYRADCELPPVGNQRWKPSIFMPRKASRITLEIESVRVERLNDISEEDAIAEGCELPPCTYFGKCRSNSCPRHGRLDRWSNAYRLLWESINGIGSWARNDFVWAITFRQLAKEPK